MSRGPSLGVIFLTVFIDLVGFGIILPLLAIYSRNYGAGGWEIGVIMAAYSVMQFLLAPFWGRLSDRIGRRPVLLVSTAGAVLAYLLFALGSSFAGRTALGIFLVSRILAGACGANITAAQAYIADITPPEKRSQGMGLIGMAFGLGFIFGPALGGLSIQWFGVAGPGWVAAALCASNFVLAWFILRESRRPDSAPVAGRPRWIQWRTTLARPRVGLLVGVFFLATFCFTCFETTLGLLVAENFHLNLDSKNDTRTIAFLYAFCGVLGALIQGGAIGRLVRLWGEANLIALSLVLLSAGLVLLPFMKAPNWSGLLAGLAILAAGSSLTRPPVFGLISNLTPASDQGATLGVAQSAGSLARILGPVFAGSLFFVAPPLPYLLSGIISLFTFLLVWQRLCPAAGKDSALAATDHGRRV